MKLLTDTRSKAIIAFSLCFSMLLASAPTGVQANSSAVARSASSIESGLTTIEERVESRRRELGIPGVALAIVKDDKVVYLKGLGLRDLENKQPVTPDTQFGIASATKAFTALSVLMSQDDGKVSLDEGPRKYLPYFKMRDADTDKNITVRDLLAHSSGLGRTDLAMITGKLNRQELIRVAGEAKPASKLRERFGYQNIMYAAAGEIVAAAQKTTWEKFVPARIFKPLGMTNSTMTIKELEKAKDRSFGYLYNFDTKTTKRVPYRSIEDTAPAGSINSSARDMAEWVRFVLNKGTVNGQRLVSESSFDEWLKPQMKISPTGSTSYGLGWFLEKWNGMTVVHHGGNIDGFNSLVAMIPEKKVGFVMLTNVSASPLGNELMPIVWSNMLDMPKPESPAANAVVPPEKEAGTYRLEAAGIDIAVTYSDGKLMANVPGQATYTLTNVSGRKYKLAEAEGFYVTFRDGEAYLEQPQGNFTLPKLGADGKPLKVATTAATAAGPVPKDLVGKYLTPAGVAAVEIKDADGKVTFNITGQQPYELARKTDGSFSMSPLPDSYSLREKRDAAGNVTAIEITQPEGVFEFKRATADSLPSITVDELHSKYVEAIGGEAAIRRITSRVIVSDVDFESQGVKGTVTSWNKAPNMSAAETTFIAIGKKIGSGWEYFDGTVGEEIYSFAPPEKLSGKRLDDVRRDSDIYAPLDWKTKFKRVEITGVTKIDGEDAYIVDFEPNAGTAFKEYFSTKTFLPVKRDGVLTSSTSSKQFPYSINYSDYRDVDGVKLPFRLVNSSPTNGTSVVIVRSIKHNEPIADKTFGPRKLK